MTASVTSWLFYLTVALTLLYGLAMLVQQSLARRLIQRNITWSTRQVEGKFIGTPEGTYWLLFLVSGRWRKVAFEDERRSCLF